MTALAERRETALPWAELPEAAEAAWWRCWSAAADRSPFQSPAWLIPWAQIYAPGRCRVIGDGDAVLPVFWWQETLFLAGTGPSDHGAELLPPGSDAAALLDGAMREAPKVQRIDLQQLPVGSPLLDCAGPAGWRDSMEPGDACLQLALAGEDGMAEVPKRWRANWRYAMRRLAREGAVVDLVPADEVPAAIETLERLHYARWSERGEAGMFADPLLRALLRLAAQRLATAGLLRLHRLRFGGEPLALLLALKGGSSTCYFLSGFDPAHARLSPGMALVGAAIAHAAREGDTAFDFLRGEEPYKHDWGARPVDRFRRVFERG